MKDILRERYRLNDAQRMPYGKRSCSMQIH